MAHDRKSWASLCYPLFPPPFVYRQNGRKFYLDVKTNLENSLRKAAKMGRPAISPTAHTARGTYRKDRHAAPAKAPAVVESPAGAYERQVIEPLADLGDAGQAVWESLVAGYADVLGAEDAAILTNIAALADFIGQAEAAIATAPDERRAQFIRAALNARNAYTRELGRFTAHLDTIRKG